MIPYCGFYLHKMSVIKEIKRHIQVNVQGCPADVKICCTASCTCSGKREEGGTVEQWARFGLRGGNPFQSVSLSPSCCFWPSALLMCLGGHRWMTQVLVSLSSLWETGIKFLASGWLSPSYYGLLGVNQRTENSLSLLFSFLPLFLPFFFFFSLLK